jgi:hypothetical protein
MQGVLVFASSAARAAAITSPQEGQYSYLKDTNSTEYYDGAAWIAAPIGDITGVTAGTGISGGGTSGTVTITNDMATTITAAGDIVVGTGSGTYDNLPIGTTAQVLTADTTVSPYKVKWATPATSASGLTLVKARTSFSAVANTGTTFDSVFTSTYKNYLVVIDNWFATTGTDDPQMQLLYSGSTDSDGYYGASFGITWESSPSTIITVQSSNTTAFNFWSSIGNGGGGTNLEIWFSGVGNTTETAKWNGTGFNASNADTYATGGKQDTTRTYTGFKLLSSSSNITGNVTVYGLAAS